MFGMTVFGIGVGFFEDIINEVKTKADIANDADLALDELDKIIGGFEQLIISQTGREFPDDPYQQLRLAIEGVFNSWEKEGARSYRKFSGIPDSAGTAVVIQRMVFGNMMNSGTGVLFTRNPRTGSSKPYIEFLACAQGEDVVGGLRSPVKVNKLAKIIGDQLYEKLIKYGRKLEKHYQQPQDIEFTIEDGKLWILQTRGLKLGSNAAFKVTSDMIDEGIITENEAVRLIRHEHISQVTSNTIRSSENQKALFAEGIPASVGAAKGHIALSPQQARENSKKGLDTILVTNHIDPNDVDTLLKNNGVVTALGGAASHMAIIMRAANVPGIVGASDIKIDFKNKIVVNEAGDELAEGDMITINGSSGKIFKGEFEIEKARPLNEAESRILDIKEDILGESPWSSACYKVSRRFQRRSQLKLIRKTLDTSRWKSRKSQIIELISKTLPPQATMQPILFDPGNTSAIREEMEKVLDEGFLNAPRSTHYPEKLSKTPWAFGPNNKEDIDEFLFGDYGGKYGGLRKWKEDKTLEAVVVSREPQEKHPDFAKEHFVFTVSFLEANPPKVIISINMNTLHLRSFERADKNQVVMLEGVVNQDSPNYLGKNNLKVSAGHILDEAAKQIIDGSEDFGLLRESIKDSNATTSTVAQFLAEQITKGRIQPLFYKKLIKPDVIAVIQAVKEKVFKDWWNPPIALPHLMSALDDELGLNVLEGQGRLKNSEVTWIKVYGTKGGEEKIRVENELGR
jgi:phosphohistidine swiveling domain-containing protein